MQTSLGTQAKKVATEFVTIVVGVLAALGVDAWNSGRLDRALGEDYVVRLKAELVQARDLLRMHQLSVDHNLEAAAFIAPYLEGDRDDVDHSILVASLYNMGRDLSMPFDVSTFQDLTSTGNLGLIRDAEARRLIQKAYQRLGEVEATARPARDEYMSGVRGWIPQAVIDDIREACPGIALEAWAGCEVGLAHHDLGPVLMRLAADDALIAFRLREQGLAGIVPIIRRSVEGLDEALAAIENRSEQYAPGST